VVMLPIFFPISSFLSLNSVKFELYLIAYSYGGKYSMLCVLTTSPWRNINALLIC